MSRNTVRKFARATLVAAALSGSLAPSLSFAQMGLYGGGNCSMSQLFWGKVFGVYCGYL